MSDPSRPASHSRSATEVARRRIATDEELLVAAAHGDGDSFRILHDRLRPTVEGVAVGVIRSPAMAEEVTQEVFGELWEKADRFDPERGSAVAWIATLTRRRAIDRVRSEQAHRDRNERVAVRDRERAFDRVADRVETRLDHWQVRAALARLTDKQREAIESAYYDGHTYRDVAAVLGVPEGTAKSRIREGLARLRELLEDHL